MTASSKFRVHSRFIPSEELGAVSEWRFGAVGPAVLELEKLPEPEAEPEESEQVRLDRAWADGHAAGFAQGHSEASLEGNQRLDDFVQGQGIETAQKLAEILSALQSRLTQAEQDIAQQVLALACGIARQVVRRELSVDEAVLKPVIQEALGLLVMDGKAAVIKLHPLDLAVLQAPLQEAFPSPTLTWLPDASVERGGCLVESGGTVVDGTLSKRWERAVASLGLASAWTDVEDGN
ncbi:FliH/SctL family protein [Rhodoferax sp.]|uniref:FliH/SctL family protein n=1 Tax=Rhodoferax sp. TaxID=50421 RepID=UPI00374D6834